VSQWPAHPHRPSLHSFTFSQLLPARASGSLAPGPRAYSTPPLRSPSQPASAAAAAARSLCPGCPVPDTFLRYRRRRHPAAATTPAQHQPPPPARITSFARSPQVRALPSAATAAAPVAAFTLLGNELPPPLLLSQSPADHASAAAAAARGACPGYPRPRHDLCRRRCRRSHGMLQPDNGVGIGHRHIPRHQVRALLAIVCRALPTARGRPRALILISSSPPPGTEACQAFCKRS
jgi:hypothetical protein